MHFQIAGFVFACIAFVSCQENFDQRIERETRQFTLNQCPKEIEPGCILDSISYDIHKRTYTWWYQLSETGVLVFTQHSSLLHQKLVERLRNDVELKAIKEQEIEFRYVYRSSETGSIVYQTSITADEYIVK